MPTCAEPTCGRWRLPLGGRFDAGLRMNGEWYCSPACVTEAVRREVLHPDEASDGGRPMQPARLGAILRSMGAVTAEALGAALASQRESGRRLGAELRREAGVPAELVLRALAAQAGMSYLTTLDLSHVRRGPGGLAGHTVRALGVVPFEADAARHRLHVACAAPPPKAAFRALASLTGWQVEPYIVEDSVFDAALAAYPDGAAPHGRGRVEADADVVARHVAQLAEARRAVTVKRAACGGLVWLRVEDEAHADDLFLRKEEPCLVASTPR
jgi:hypothetical protein